MKPVETSRSIAKNVFYGFTTWFLPLGFSFVSNPYIIGALGSEDYGIYSLIMVFIANSFTFNVGRAVTKYIAEYRVAGESEKIREIISTTFFFNFFICAVGAAAVFGFAERFATDVLQIPDADRVKAVNGLYLATFGVVFTAFNQLFHAVLQGFQRFDVFAKISNYTNILFLAGNIIIAVTTKNLLYLVAWNVFSLAITCLIFFVSARKLLPEFGIEFRFRKETLKLVVAYSSSIVGYQILANLLLLFERTVVVRHFGAEGLTFYVVPMVLAFYIHSFIQSLTLVVFPVASELQNDKTRLLMLYKKALTLVCVPVFFIATTVITLSEQFLHLWVGDVFVRNSTALLALHTVSFSILAVGIVSWQMTEGLGFPKINLYVYAISFAVTVPSMLLLMVNFGLEGVAAGRLLGFAVLFFSIWYIEKKFFGGVERRFWALLLLKLAVAAAAAAVIEKLIIVNFPVGWILLFISALAGGAMFISALAATNFFSADEKKMFFALVKNGGFNEKS